MQTNQSQILKTIVTDAEDEAAAGGQLFPFLAVGLACSRFLPVKGEGGVPCHCSDLGVLASG